MRKISELLFVLIIGSSVAWGGEGDEQKRPGESENMYAEAPSAKRQQKTLSDSDDTSITPFVEPSTSTETSNSNSNSGASSPRDGSEEKDRDCRDAEKQHTQSIAVDKGICYPFEQKTQQSTKFPNPNGQQKMADAEGNSRFFIAKNSFYYTKTFTEIAMEIGIKNISDDSETLIKLAEKLKSLCEKLKKEAESVITFVKESPGFKFCCGLVVLYLHKMGIREDLARSLFNECSSEEMNRGNIFSVIKSDPGQEASFFVEYIEDYVGLENV